MIRQTLKIADGSPFFNKKGAAQSALLGAWRRLERAEVFKSMLSFSLPGCKRKILFSAALNFSPDRPHPTAKFALLRLYELSGHTALEMTIVPQQGPWEGRMPVQELPNGIYLLRAANAQVNQTIKLVVTH